MMRFATVGFLASVAVACTAPMRLAAQQDLDPSPGDRLNPTAAAAVVKVAAAKRTPRGDRKSVV